MDQATINKIKADYPDAFFAKRAILGSDTSAAAVIQRQIEYDAANPPRVGAVMRAKEATNHANGLRQMWLNAHHGAELLRNAALELHAEAELPALEGEDASATAAEDQTPILQKIAACSSITEVRKILAEQ
jgi:hypothetical protein